MGDTIPSEVSLRKTVEFMRAGSIDRKGRALRRGHLSGVTNESVGLQRCNASGVVARTKHCNSRSRAPGTSPAIEIPERRRRRLPPNANGDRC